jgi:hypothetical protein
LASTSPHPRKQIKSAEHTELKAAANRLAEALADLDEDELVAEFKSYAVATRLPRAEIIILDVNGRASTLTYNRETCSYAGRSSTPSMNPSDATGPEAKYADHLVGRADNPYFSRTREKTPGFATPLAMP